MNNSYLVDVPIRRKRQKKKMNMASRYSQEQLDWLELRNCENLIIMKFDRDGVMLPIDGDTQRKHISGNIVEAKLAKWVYYDSSNNPPQVTGRRLVLTEKGKAIHKRLVEEGLIK